MVNESVLISSHWWLSKTERADKPPPFFVKWIDIINIFTIPFNNTAINFYCKIWWTKYTWFPERKHRLLLVSVSLGENLILSFVSNNVAKDLENEKNWVYAARGSKSRSRKKIQIAIFHRNHVYKSIIIKLCDQKVGPTCILQHWKVRLTGCKFWRTMMAFHLCGDLLEEFKIS